MPARARRRFFLGNWKMNVTLQQAGVLAGELRAASMNWSAANIRDVIIAPPLLAVPRVAAELVGSRIGVAGQNIHWENNGPYTGETSASTLRELGVTHVLIGHSERRDQFNESNEVINRKLDGVLVGAASVKCESFTVG